MRNPSRKSKTALPHSPRIRSRLAAPIAVAAATVAVISGCSELSSDNATLRTQNANPALNSSTSLAMNLPRSVSDAYGRALTDNISGLYALARFNNSQTLCFEPDSTDPTLFDARQRTSVEVNEGETLAIDIRWYETLETTQTCATNGLLLAYYAQTTEPIDSNRTINLDISEYIVDGDNALDADNDGTSNLAERQAGTDPLVADERADGTPDVRISFVETANAPTIDGEYDQIYTTRAQFNDDDGNPLNIDNLMVNDGISPLRSDGNTDFRWFAMYDDTSLYIFVLGERVSNGNPVRDSTEVYLDDSIDIFIDADNSKGSSYDGINDRHILIPLLTNVGDLTSNSTYFEAGPNSASIPSFEFATCYCINDTDGQHTWEVRIPMAEFGIQPDTPFGLEVQVNMDNDGNARDAKWAWIHPSRTSINVDNTFQNPSFMGTAVLN